MTLVVGLVLVAAVLHAGWNALAKALPDALVVSGAIGVVYLVVGGVAAALLPLPRPASWPFVVVSALLETLYLVLLTAAYRHGEFGRVYPLARGLSPLLVTAVALTVLGQRLSPLGLVGVALICAALCGLLLAGGRPRRGDGLGMAALTGVTIASYTLVDGVGVHRAGNPLSYAAWLFLLEGPVLPVACRLLGGPGLFRRMAGHAGRGTAIGVLALLAYGIVVYAQSRGALAEIAALRETSVLFAGIIGATVFWERFGGIRIAVTAVAAAGIVLLELAG